MTIKPSHVRRQEMSRKGQNEINLFTDRLFPRIIEQIQSYLYLKNSSY